MNNKTERIRMINDAFRQSFVGGKVMITQGVGNLGQKQQADLLAKVQGFFAFSTKNDPHREHDFGTVELEGQKFFWKIDYYNKAMDA